MSTRFFAKTTRVGTVAVFSVLLIAVVLGQDPDPSIGDDLWLIVYGRSEVVGADLGAALVVIDDLPDNVDVDAVPEFAVGAPGINGGAGEVTIRSGATLEVFVTVSPPVGVGAGAAFGASVVATDIDGDSDLEVVIGMPGAFGGKGGFYVYDPHTRSAVAHVASPGAPPGVVEGHLFGAGLGKQLLTVGSPTSLAGVRILAVAEDYSDGDGIVVCYGLDGTIQWVRVGRPNERFGARLAAYDDHDGDDVDDVLVGAPGAFGGEGGLMIVSGATGVVLADVRLSSPSPARGFGSALLRRGTEWVIGAEGDDVTPGRVFVISMAPPHSIVHISAVTGGGGPNSTPLPPIIVPMMIAQLNAGTDAASDYSAPGDRFGAALAGAVDLNGDAAGLPEIAVGSPGAGRTFIYSFDGASFALECLSASAAPASDRVGETLGLLGDADGNGHPDLIIGAPGVASRRGELRLVQPVVCSSLCEEDLELWVGVGASVEAAIADLGTSSLTKIAGPGDYIVVRVVSPSGTYDKALFGHPDDSVRALGAFRNGEMPGVHSLFGELQLGVAPVMKEVQLISDHDGDGQPDMPGGATYHQFWVGPIPSGLAGWSVMFQAGVIDDDNPLTWPCPVLAVTLPGVFRLRGS